MNLEENTLDKIKIENIPAFGKQSLENIDHCITAFFKEEVINENYLKKVIDAIYSCKEDQKVKNEIFTAFGTLISLRKDVNNKLCEFLEHISRRD